MHKYVVMAHADGPADLAGKITTMVLNHHGDVVNLVIDEDAASQNPSQMFDFVGIFDVHDMEEPEIMSLDEQIRGLVPDQAQTIETMRD